MVACAGKLNSERKRQVPRGLQPSGQEVLLVRKYDAGITRSVAPDERNVVGGSNGAWLFRSMACTQMTHDCIH